MIYTDETSCDDIVKAWDRGEAVWSVEMGGLGPGYEQVIQIIMVECLRELVRVGFDWHHGTKDEVSERAHALLDPVVLRIGRQFGCSGSQAAAALSIAAKFHRYRPKFMLHKAPLSRQIQVSKTFPSLSPPEGP